MVCIHLDFSASNLNLCLSYLKLEYCDEMDCRSFPGRPPTQPTRITCVIIHLNDERPTRKILGSVFVLVWHV